LTGLYNRRGFNTLNPDLLLQLQSGTANGYIACFDLDHFKQINDVHGHATGDTALVEFATLLRSAFRKEGLFARLGGDEFLAMGIEAHPGAATEALAGLEQLLEARNAAGLSPFRLETSTGLLLLAPQDRHSLGELLARADAELYRNKEARHAGRPAAPPPPPPKEPQPVAVTHDFQYPWQEILHRLRATCELYDPELVRHHDRVGTIAAGLARHLALPAEQVERIRIAAAIHDVGKIGVSRTVLEHTGPLNAQELAIVRSHTEIGYRLLDGSEWAEIRCAADVAFSHHECWDGSGYPRALRGKEISLEARIVAIADVFDALRSERAYKEAWTDERVIAEMKLVRATQFDPDLFDVFLSSHAVLLPVA